jgi:hypothetical protein
VEGCAAALTASTCPQFLGNTPIAACEARVGTIANGAACAYASQCQSTYCSIPNGSACGTCAALPKVGDSCAITGDCGPGLHCGKTDQLCSAFATTGGACDKDDVCDLGLGCVGAKGTTKGTCQPLGGAEGATCDSKAQTAAGCDRSLGLWCPSTGKCAKISSFVKTGDPCGLIDATTYAACTGGANCIVPTGGAGKGTCMGPSNAGGPCDDSGGGASCVLGSRCVVTGGADAGATGTCAAIDPTVCK